MIAAGIKDLKNRLSHYLALVKHGEEVVVTERGKAVARIVQEANLDEPIRAALGPLVVRGTVRLPTRPVDRQIRPLVKLPGKPVAEVVLEDRR
jgi:prevent-host-death family protein